MDVGVAVSSPDEATLFARSEPLNLLKREPNLDEEPLLFIRVSGKASRLFDVDTSLGFEISFGSTRLRIDDEWDKPSGRLMDEEVLFSAIIAASAFFCTSRTSSASCCGVCG